MKISKIYDFLKDKDGMIDFREFIIGLSLLSRPANTEDTIKLSFQVKLIYCGLLIYTNKNF